MSPAHRIHHRDNGLDRVSRLTRWTLGGGLVLSGAFSVLAQHAFAQSVQHKAIETASARTAATAVHPTRPVTSPKPTAKPTTPTTRVHRLTPPPTVPRAVHHVPTTHTTPHTTPATTPHTTPVTRPRVIVTAPPPVVTAPPVVSGGS